MSTKKTLNDEELIKYKKELFSEKKFLDSSMLNVFTFFYNEVCDLIFYNFMFIKEGSPFSSFLGNDRDSVYNIIKDNFHIYKSKEEYNIAKDIEEDSRAVSRTVILLDALFETFLNDLISADKTLTNQQKVYIKKKGFKLTKEHIISSYFYKDIEKTKLWELMIQLRETSNFYKHNYDLVNLEKNDINLDTKLSQIKTPSSKELVNTLGYSMIDFFDYISSNEIFYKKGIGNLSNTKESIILHKETLRTYIDYINKKFNL